MISRHDRAEILFNPLAEPVINYSAGCRRLVQGLLLSQAVA